MQQIKLEKSLKAEWAVQLPLGGWAVTVVEKKGGDYHYPMIVHPGKEPFTFHCRGHICNAAYGMDEQKHCALTAICFVKNDKDGKELGRFPVGKDGKIIPSVERDGKFVYPFEQAIQPPHYPNEHPDYFGSVFKKEDIDLNHLPTRLLHAAAGVLDGGIILLRFSDNKTVVMSIPCEKSKVTFSADGLTFLCLSKNLITIVDNPLV